MQCLHENLKLGRENYPVIDGGERGGVMRCVVVAIHFVAPQRRGAGLVEPTFNN
jgi:hypothetical protein